jgi:hypothetical protein
MLTASLQDAHSALAAHADERVHVAVVGGLGLAQGLLGGHLELRKANLAIFVGTGLIFSTTVDAPFLAGDRFGGQGYGGVVGLRWYSRHSGDGLFLSPQFAFSTQQVPGDAAEHFPATWRHTNASTLTAGWRFKWGGFLVDAAARTRLHARDRLRALE